MAEITEILSALEATKDRYDQLSKDTKELKKNKEILENAVLEYYATNGLQSMDTTRFKWFQQDKTNFTIDNADALYNHIIASDTPELLQKRINATETKAFFEEHGVLPPGVSSFTKKVLRSRKK